ncbi:MAG TPA: long-chain fatty acid--CoA ligase [Ktedonobacterales bacterium]
MAAPKLTESNMAQVFRNRSATYAKAVRWRQKQGDAWAQQTWGEHLRLVNALAGGLEVLGARPGDVIGIASAVRWEWSAADWAITEMGCATVTLYPSNIAAVNEFILTDSGAKLIFAEDIAQYEKLKSIQAKIPHVSKVILFTGADQIQDDWVISFDAVSKLGTRSPKEQDALMAERVASISPEQPITLVYTSGTTGMPKGVELTHNNVVRQLQGARAMFPELEAQQVDVLFLPLAHIYGRLQQYVGIDRGFETVYVPSFDLLAQNLQEARPHLLFSVPRVYEKVYAGVKAKVAAGSDTQKRIFAWAERVGRDVAKRKEAGKSIPPGLALRYGLANRLVFKNVRAVLGGRLRLAITGAAPLDINILEFFNAAGVTLLEGWGLTETTAGFTTNSLTNYRMGTVGRPYPGSELRIADDGEILARGPSILKRYHNNPEASAEAIDADGWFHTGDVGEVDADGYLRIVDRKKDLIITAGGKNIGPQGIEGQFKMVPLVSQCVVFGDKKPFLVGLFTLDPLALHKWASDNGIQAADDAELVKRPELRAFLAPRIAAVNDALASYETVKYWDILPEDFTVQNELLTPSLKIRRKEIYRRYADTFEALYQQADAARAGAPA